MGCVFCLLFDDLLFGYFMWSCLRWVFGFVVLEEMGLEFEGIKTTERVGEMGFRRRGSREAMVATVIILYLTKVITEKRKRKRP